MTGERLIYLYENMTEKSLNVPCNNQGSEEEEECKSCPLIEIILDGKTKGKEYSCKQAIKIFYENYKKAEIQI